MNLPIVSIKFAAFSSDTIPANDYNATLFLIVFFLLLEYISLSFSIFDWKPANPFVLLRVLPLAPRKDILCSPEGEVLVICSFPSMLRTCDLARSVHVAFMSFVYY